MTMLDRIANAVIELEREKGDAFDIGDAMARKIARAALTAMRCLPPPAVDDLDPPTITRARWSAMIDAILADAPPCPSAPGSVE